MTAFITAKVFLGYDVKSGQPVAIKVMDTGSLLSKNPKLAIYLKNELDILGTLNCDNIVKLYDVVVSYFYFLLPNLELSAFLKLLFHSLLFLFFAFFSFFL